MSDTEIQSLKVEYDNERSFRNLSSWKNSELVKSIMKVEEQLSLNEYKSPLVNEYEKETSRNSQLIKVIEALREQIPAIKEKIKNTKGCGADCTLKYDDLNINLDILTQMELHKTVKKFLRTKMDLESEIRSKEWKLDSDAKYVMRLRDQRAYLKNELLILERKLSKLERSGIYGNNSWMSDSSERVVKAFRPLVKRSIEQKLPQIKV